MKANKAPEKIFLSNKQRPDKEIFYVFATPVENNDIEYIRVDVLIEKAKKWFEKQNEWIDLNGVRHCDMESFEDFVNYMTGNLPQRNDCK